MSKFLACIAVALLAFSTARAEDAFRVVVHPKNPVDAIDRGELSSLFLKRTTRWRDGQTVTPVELAEGDPRERFCADVHGKSASTIKTYWARLVFAGRETPPVAKSSDDEVLAFVRTNPGAIGYVSPAALLAGVKVVKVQ